MLNLKKTKYGQSYFQSFIYKGKLNSQRDRKRLKEILKYKGGGKLLEIGSGEGYFLKLAKKWFNSSGVEISNYATKFAAGHLNLKLRNHDVEKLKLSANKFDVVAAFNVLEHLKDTNKTLKKIYSSLSNRGVFIGSTPNNQGVVGRLFTQLSNYFDETHRSTLRSSAWEKLLKEVGFETCEFFGEVPFGRNRSFYIKRKVWRWVSLNMVFVCKKA